MKKYYATLDGTGCSVEIGLTLDDAKKCYHQGNCDYDVEDVCKKEYVKEQMKGYSIHDFTDVLDNYGCSYDDGDTKEELFEIIVWLAAGDIIDDEYRETFTKIIEE